MAAATKTVRIKFDGDTSGLDRASAKGKRTLAGWSDSLDKVDESFKRTGTSSDQMAKRTVTSLDKIDRTLKNLRANVEENHQAFAATGDVQLFRSISRDQSLIKKLERVRAEVVRINDEATKHGDRLSTGLSGGFIRGAQKMLKDAAAFGVKISTSMVEKIPGAFGGALSALPPQAQVGIVAGIAAAITAGSAFIGAAVSGAILGGLGTGAIATGVVLAFQDTRVKKAGKSLADTVMAGLRDAAGVFVQPTLRSIDIIRRGFLALQPDIARAFRAAAPFTEVLTRGLVALVRNVMPGLTKALERSGPLVKTIAAGMAQIGAAVSTFFKDLARNSDGANQALKDLFTLIAVTVVVTGKLISELASAYEKASLLGEILSGDVTGAVAQLADKHARAGQTGNDFAGSLDKIRQEAEKATQATRNQESAVKSLADTLRAQTDPIFAFESATRQVKEAQDKVKEAQDKFGAKSPQYRQALEDLAQAQLNLYGAAGDLSSTTNQNLLPALEQLRRDGYLSQGSFDALKAAIDRAKAAADKADGTRIRINTAEALAAISRVQQSLGKIKDIHVGVYFDPKGNLKLPGGRQVIGAAGGGMVGGFGTSTSDSNLVRLSKGEFVVRAAAVRAVGSQFLAAINRAGPGSGRSVLASRDYLTAAARTAVPSAPVAAGPSFPEVLHLTLDLGHGIRQVVQLNLSEHDRGLRRRVLAGVSR